MPHQETTLQTVLEKGFQVPWPIVREDLDHVVNKRIVLHQRKSESRSSTDLPMVFFMPQSVVSWTDVTEVVCKPNIAQMKDSLSSDDVRMTVQRLWKYPSNENQVSSNWFKLLVGLSIACNTAEVASFSVSPEKARQYTRADIAVGNHEKKGC
jgi:hypothetical protein